ncbi:phosphoribosylformylglycinamidine synthase subunit PurL [Patescibacteria group bacterium]|nr:phosphoribosylformylglycinamidine synthase subunit PurL [Patescibacteria group bacterium]MBU2259893.1 phosphoribosylformylglycinamidine synthase subunit PurL [Patescibacteria group bacterium]
MSAKKQSSVTSLPFSEMSDADVLSTLQKYQIVLTVEEARKISEMLGRDPTLVEAVIWGIQGSEHCSYKSSSRFLKNFPTSGKHIILGPGEDSGIVAITDGPNGRRWGLVISHESHNHPSQIVPFEGAATGIGGVVRDVVCMGARIVGCLDLLRLGDLKTEESKTIASEVARGIAGYGNPLGIPNLGGDTVFDSSYNSNCLVNAIALGIVREDEVIHSYVPQEAGKVGYDIIYVGKSTDRSGFGGASFASTTLEADDEEQNTGAVQEPNPFLERHLLASTYALFDWLAEAKKLDKVSFKDLGAGGVVCASVEQVADQGFGADVDLDKVHVSIPDLPAEVIACAETQERFCWICHPDLTQHILKHYNEDWDLPSIAENARASLAGKVTEGGVYRLTHKGQTVVEAKALDITCGLQYARPTKKIDVDFIEPEICCVGEEISVQRPTSNDEKETLDVGPSTFKTTITDIFKHMIVHPNNASTSPITKHYDKNVIGNTIIEPGEADAGVIAPLQDLESFVHVGMHPGWDLTDEEKWRGVAVAGDGNGRYGRISPYLEGLNASVESMRNVTAVGASPRAVTDCLNFGNPEIPEQLWQFEEAVRGIVDATKGVDVEGENVPVVSGNVSFYNGQADGSSTSAERSRSIDPTAIVCCVGIISDARKAITMQLKKAGSKLFLIGKRKDECGGSGYYEILENMSGAPRNAILGKNIPVPDLKEVSLQIALVTHLIEEGLLNACHDISNGGLLMTLFEMTLPQRKVGGDIGISVDLSALQSSLRPDTLLFSETGGFVIEVNPDNEEAVGKIAGHLGITLLPLGESTDSPTLDISHNNTLLLSDKLNSLHEVWNNGLKKAIK